LALTRFDTVSIVPRRRHSVVIEFLFLRHFLKVGMGADRRLSLPESAFFRGANDSRSGVVGTFTFAHLSQMLVWSWVALPFGTSLWCPEYSAECILSPGGNPEFKSDADKHHHAR